MLFIFAITSEIPLKWVFVMKGLEIFEIQAEFAYNQSR